MKNLVCLISGRGSNLAALLAAARSEQWEDTIGARIAAVISNRADAAGLAIARAGGVPARDLAHQPFATREAFDAALAALIDEYDPVLVVLAGFMRVLTDAFIDRYDGRLINIHPSLLPSFRGLATHHAALAAGVRVHGATVHFVGREVDGGAIIAQAAVPVAPDDTEIALAARVLAQEHRLLPRCVRLLLAGRIRLVAGRVQYDGIAADEIAVLAPVPQ